MTHYSQLRGLKLLSLTCAFLLGAWGVPQAAAQTVATPVITSTAVPVGTTGSLAIPPSGITVTVACATGTAEIRYTLDGSEPTQTSSLYTGPVFIAEQLGLIDTKTVTFKAKGFAAGMTESPTASASFLNYAEAEFTMQFRLVGVSDQQTLLKLGLATGATDEMDAGLDFAVASSEPPVLGDDGMPPLPGEAVRSVTPGKDFLITDYRSRSKLKEWPLYVASKTTTTSITLQWGSEAGLPVPAAAYLHLLIDTNSDGTDDLDFDLTDSSAGVKHVELTKKYSPYDDGGFLTSRCRVVYRNNQGTLTAAIAPAAVTDPADPATAAQWWYRVPGSIAEPGAGDWLPSGATVTGLHDGNYEVMFKRVSPDLAFYRPPNQIVSVVAGATTAVTASYTEKAATATMTVSPTYDATTKTVQVDCTFAASPDVSLTMVDWTFAVPPGWAISAVNLPADSVWTHAATVDNLDGTVTLTFTRPGGRATGTGDLSFSTEWSYAGDDPGDVTFVVNNVAGDPGIGADPPPQQTSTPRTATLDVNGTSVVDSKDCVYIYRYIALGKRAGTGLRLNAFYELGAGVTEADVETTIAGMVGGLALDVNGSGVVDSKDCVYIYRYVALGKRTGTGLRLNSFYELGAGVTEADVQTNIEALLP